LSGTGASGELLVKIDLSVSEKSLIFDGYFDLEKQLQKI
jgi:hypothetical protein